MKGIKFSVVFNRASHINKNGESCIHIQALQGKERVLFSTDIFVRHDQFEGGLVVNHPLFDKCNKAILRMKLDIEAIQLYFMGNGIYLSPSKLKEIYYSKSSPTNTVIEFGKEIVKSSNRRDSTVLGYDTFFNNLDKFKKDLKLSDVTYSTICAYDAFLTESGISHNTKVGRLRQFKAIMEEAVKREIIQKNPFKLFKIPSMISKKGFISETHLRKLEELKVIGNERNVLNAFLFCCYSGLRFSDFKTLTSANIRTGWLVKDMIKTNFKVEIPIERLFQGKALGIIKQYGSIERLVKRIGCNATVNKILKGLFARV